VTLTVSPTSARSAVFETATVRGDAAPAGDKIAPLATKAEAVRPRSVLFRNVFIITLFSLSR
jgi:hypothetical protein